MIHRILACIVQRYWVLEKWLLQKSYNLWSLHVCYCLMTIAYTVYRVIFALCYFHFSTHVHYFACLKSTQTLLCFVHVELKFFTLSLILPLMIGVKGAKTKWGECFSCKQYTTGGRKICTYCMLQYVQNALYIAIAYILSFIFENPNLFIEWIIS